MRHFLELELEGLNEDEYDVDSCSGQSLALDCENCMSMDDLDDDGLDELDTWPAVDGYATR